MLSSANGEPTDNLKSVDRALLNPWPKELEAAFQRRASEVTPTLMRSENQEVGVNTRFENEKRTDGYVRSFYAGRLVVKMRRMRQTFECAVFDVCWSHEGRAVMRRIGFGTLAL